MADKKVEFIESYIKHGNSDYQWNDNHGELIRCHDCRYAEPVYDFLGTIQNDVVYCKNIRCHKKIEWYCADGERKEGEQDD